MNAPPDISTSPRNPEGEPVGTAAVPVDVPTPMLSGLSMVAAFRAQRAVLRANLHQARRRARAERQGREPIPPDPAPVSAHVSAIADPPPGRQAADSADEGSEGAGSVFASLVSLAVAERAGSVIEQILEPPVEPSVDAAAAPEPAADALPEPPPSEDLHAEPLVSEDQYDPPLAEIGFGPGMLIRLSQLGLHTTGDLAQANAGELRAALGDISRLVDVETWISNARQTTKVGG